MGRIYIGTSGWHYSHWVGPFYPLGMASKEFLPHYASHFTTVEINNTFYHLPTVSTLENWLAQTPKNFLFTCKGSRFITHMKKLKDPEQSIQRFFENIQVLRKKLGPILFQLPPRWRINVDRLETFLKALPKKYRYAFEFRDESWFAQPVYDVLAKHNAAFCLYNLAGLWTPEIGTADFIYIRLHGPEDVYQGHYPQKILSHWAKKCLFWARNRKDVYCYFNNDEKAYASQDAVALRNLVKGQQKKTSVY